MRCKDVEEMNLEHHHQQCNNCMVVDIFDTDATVQRDALQEFAI
jgi:hypothetical protein